jgi:hypothetical protein
MPGALVKTPAKRVLAEATNTRQNIAPSHIHSAKKRKLEVSSNGLKPPGADAKSGMSQPKSEFEEQLEKMSQDMSGLKKKNSERDQHWARPNLADFDDVKDSICFQQIEVEEGTLSGGKQTIRLFGVTEVGRLRAYSCGLTDLNPDWTFCITSRHRFPPLPVHRRTHQLPAERLQRIPNLPRGPARPACCHH